MLNFIDPKLENYCVSKSSLPSKYCRAIFEYTQQNVPFPQMLIGELEASFLRFLVGLIRAKRILEIGCFTGYSALAMAEGLTQNGELVTLDINPDTTKIAQEFWKKSPNGGKIKLFLGKAAESLQKIKGPFDFIFIDADKSNYKKYFLKALTLLSLSGMIAVDNCLWGGEVLKGHSKDQDTNAIVEFNHYVRSRVDLEATLVPIRDGVFLIRSR